MGAQTTPRGRKNTFLLISLFVQSYWICFVHGLTVDLFTAKDRHGNSIRVDVSDRDCTNFPQPWIGRVVSVDTMGNCMQFYEDTFCRGSLTVLQPFHTIHQMDLSLISFANVIKSASPCGPKVSEGRYVIQNAADASILTVDNRRGTFATALTKAPTKVIQKSQMWDVTEASLSEFTLRPREHEDNYPVSFDESSLERGKIVRKRWQFLSVGRGRYIIKGLTSQKCLYKTNEQKVEENACRIFSPNQEWVFRSILTPNPSPTKSKVPVGPGLNLNILSKVSHYRPNRPKTPELIPIYLNSSIAHQLVHPSLTSPYQIRKKIKRGPRPQSQIQNLPLGLRPPGLRPALPSRISNNNDFLLLKLPSSQAAKRPIIIPHTIPNDKEDEDTADSKEEEASEEKEADEDEDEEEDGDGGGGNFRDNRESRRPNLQVDTKSTHFNRLKSTATQHSMNNAYAPYSTTGSFKKGVGNNPSKYATPSKEDVDSKEEIGFMNLLMKKVKDKVTSVVWHKQQKKKKQSNQKQLKSLEDFLADLE